MKHLRQLNFTLWLAALLPVMTVMPVSAQEVTIKGIKYYCEPDSDIAYVMRGEDSLKGDIIIPETIVHKDKTYKVKKIKEYAFSKLKRITSVTIPDAITEIDCAAFSYCTGLKSAILGNSIKTLEYGTFSNCTAMTSVTIGKSINTINRSFTNCQKLEEIHISDIAAWCNITCDNKLYVEEYKTDNPINIAHAIYADDELITDLVIPNTTEQIKSGIFARCKSLKTVTIPNSVTKIEKYAFYECNNINTVTIGNSVNEIGAYAFACDNLSTVYCACKTPPTIQTWTIGSNNVYIGKSQTIRDAFTNYDATLYVPTGSKQLYSEHPIWGKFKEIIESEAFGQNDGNAVAVDGVEYYRISGTETAMARKAPDCNGDVTILESVDINGTPCTVTRLCTNAFTDCNSVTSIKIPDTVTTIGDYAFKGCGNLKAVTLGNSITEIRNTFFKECRALESLTIGKSVQSIESYSFNDCESLKEVHISDLDAWYNIKFYDMTSNPLAYGHYLYLNDRLITDLVIPESLKTINDFTFNGCYSLNSIKFHDTFKYIGIGAFSNCIGLTSVTFGKSIEYVQNYAFSYCKSLTTIEFPDSDTSNILGDGAFSNCTGLKSVTFGKSIHDIGFDTFSYCKNLTTVEIPDWITSIHCGAFDHCELKTIILGKSVRDIGYDAFCHNTLPTGEPTIKTIYCLPETPPRVYLYEDISICTFDNYDATLYVPEGCYYDYLYEEPWGRFRKIIELGGDSGAQSIESDGESLPTEYYNMSGVKVATAAPGESPGESPAGLPAGIYITRCGDKTSKVVIR